MGSPPESRSFDPRDALESARYYMDSTGIECRVVDNAGKVVSAYAGQDGEDQHHPCRFCRHFVKITGRSVPCAQAHLYGSYQSQRFGGRYTYFCPLALTHISAPILDDGVMVAFFVAGPFLLIEPDDYVSDELQEHFGIAGPGLGVLRDLLADIPYVLPGRARSLGEQLLYTASWVSGRNVREIVDEERRISTDARVSEYIRHIKTMGGDAADAYPVELERRLVAMIRDGRREETSDALARWIAELRVATGDDLGTMKARVLELAVVLSRASIDGGADAESVFGVNYRAIEAINRFSSVDDLGYWLSTITERFVQFVFDVKAVGNRDVILKATRYLRVHYPDKIGLEDVAAEVGLSPAYLSRLFGEETGSTLTTYLNRLRVDRAKDLLLGSQRQIAAIAIEVGFSDQSHFSRVFRKYAAMSPATYRRHRGVAPRDSHEIHD